ncbi:MAG: hypothetical protein COA53_09475 [Rhodobacteraceae bacterium]|nr:MAG: hypothetical protein COA53_09475 [Paracoccaceae bacterium]
MRRMLALALIFLSGHSVVQAQDFSLSSPAALHDNGFMRFLVPRFSLKTGVHPELKIDVSDVDISLNTTTGTPVFEGLGQVFYFSLAADHPDRTVKAQRFIDWLVSDIGKRTIEQFKVDDVPVFTAVIVGVDEEHIPVFEGDVTRGEALSFTNCGRCHVINARNRMKGIGSTPSFGLLRTLPDWLERFQTFSERLPHPSIIQIIDVSEPFSPFSPPANRPVELTVDQLEDIMTYIVTIQPIDLGAPLQQN